MARRCQLRDQFAGGTANWRSQTHLRFRRPYSVANVRESVINAGLAFVTIRTTDGDRLYDSVIVIDVRQRLSVWTRLVGSRPMNKVASAAERLLDLGRISALQISQASSYCI
jgi:hypothetical protein